MHGRTIIKCIFLHSQRRKNTSNYWGVCLFVSRPLLGPEASEAGPIPPPLGRHLLRTSWAHVHVDPNISSVVVTTTGLRLASSSTPNSSPPPPLHHCRPNEDTPRKRRFGRKPFCFSLGLVFSLDRLLKRVFWRDVIELWLKAGVRWQERRRHHCCYATTWANLENMHNVTSTVLSASLAS